MRDKPASALVLTAMIATSISAAALAMMSSAHQVRLESSETLRFLRARLAAESLVARAGLQLDREIEVSAAPIAGCIRDESGSACWRSTDGLIDLNTAQEETFARLFVAAGFAEDRAKQNARALVEARAKLAAKKANQPTFQYETELLEITEMTPDTEKILPYVTVFSGLMFPAYSALPPKLQPYFAAAAPDPFATTGFGRVYLIEARAPLSSAAVLEVRVWVRPTGNPRQPLLIHRQEERLMAEDAT